MDWILVVWLGTNLFLYSHPMSHPACLSAGREVEAAVPELKWVCVKKEVRR